MRFGGGRLEGDLSRILKDYTFEFEGKNSDGANGVYYSTDRTRELNQQFGDIYHKVCLSPCVGSAQAPGLVQVTQEGPAFGFYFLLFGSLYPKP